MHINKEKIKRAIEKYGPGVGVTLIAVGVVITTKQKFGKTYGLIDLDSEMRGWVANGGKVWVNRFDHSLWVQKPPVKEVVMSL